MLVCLHCQVITPSAPNDASFNFGIRVQTSDQPFAIDGYKVKRVNWHHFEPIYLPARLPYLNPIERLWLRLKADWFNDWIAKTSPQLQDRLIEALQYLFAQPSLIQTQCRPKTSL